MTHSNQVDTYLATQPQEPPDIPSGDPEVIFHTALSAELDREQEQAMVAHFLKRYDELRDELGANQAQGDSWWEGCRNLQLSSIKFLAKRRMWEMTYHQNFDWRRWILGGLFEMGQNLHLPYTTKTVTQMISRAQNYFFGSDPWFSVNPMPAKDTMPDAAEQVDAFAKHKFRLADVMGAGNTAIEKAFIRGEAVMKTSHWLDSIDYTSFSNVAVVSLKDQRTPLMANDGDYIYDTDRWVQVPDIDPITKQGIDQEATTAGTLPDYSQFPTKLVLERDNTTSYPEEGSGSLQQGQLIFRKLPVPRTKVRYRGPVADNVFGNDFLCPLAAKSVQLADSCFHVQDIAALQLVKMARERDRISGAPDEDAKKRLDELLRLGTLSSGAQTDTQAGKPRRDLKEGAAFGSVPRGAPILNVAEGYMTYSAKGDGTLQEIFMMVDLTSKKPIIYDHLPNVFPDAKRPFHVVRINPVEERWYGIGMVEIFSELQRIIDLLVNRWEFSTSTAGTVTFFNASLTKEGDANPNLELNVGETLTPKDAQTPFEKIVGRIPLHEFKGETLKPILDMFAQMLTNMGGVATTNDADAAGLNPTKLATGIRNIQQSGEEQFAPLVRHLETGVESMLTALVYLLVAYSEDQEKYNVLNNGKFVPMAIDTINVRNLDFSVDIELSRYHGEQKMAQINGAIQTASTYYALQPEIQIRLEQLYRALFKLFQVGNVDNVIVPMNPENYGSGAQVAGALPAGGAPPVQAPQEGDQTQEPEGAPSNVESISAGSSPPPAQAAA